MRKAERKYIVAIKNNKATIHKEYNEVAELIGKHRNTISLWANSKEGFKITGEYTLYFNVSHPNKSKRGGKKDKCDI